MLTFGGEGLLGKQAIGAQRSQIEKKRRGERRGFDFILYSGQFDAFELKILN
jgi:hypothetical protein